MALERTIGVHLPEPTVFTRPAPFPGCDACVAFEREWVAATTPRSDTYDPSRATDIVVLMRRHKNEAHGGAK